MKRVLSVFILLIIVTGLFSFPQTVKADCVCYTEPDMGGEAYSLANTTDRTTDEECKMSCVAATDDAGESLNYEDGYIATIDTLEDQVATQAQNTAGNVQAIPGGTCTCYCGSKGKGAVIVPNETFQTTGECSSWCGSDGAIFNVCAFEPDQMPIANGLCWSQQDCAASGGEWDGDQGNQPAECEPGDHYCYPPAEAVQLSVHIGETTKVYNIGTYINVIYTYGLGAATVFAIVMIMIGGVQYMMGSATGGEAVGAAKTRITNATTGLVLLLVIYTILYVVNPATTIFKTIQMPRIKPSLFVQGSCEKYTAKGYIVGDAGDGTTCGKEGIVANDPNGIAMSQSCIYDDCSQDPDAPGGKCAELNGSYKCMECVDGGTEATEQGFVPSEAQCAALTPTPNASKPTENYQCKLGLTSVGVSGYDYEDACVLVKLDCAHVSKCSDYGRVDAQGAGNSMVQKLEGGADTIGKPYFDVCNANACPNVTNGPCVAVDTDEVSSESQLGNGTVSPQIEAQYEYGLRSHLLPQSVILQESQFSDAYIAVGVYNFSVGCIPRSIIK